MATLEALLGAENVSSPSIPSLVGTFGEQPLIGKTLAIFSDISWAHRDIVTGVEILKAISGQDTRDVNRKNREAWHGKLGVRFMIAGNDMPKFTDASGALAGRFVHVQFTRSLAGREDPTLKGRILEELAGVLNWAIEGLRDLQITGRFAEPQTSEDLAAEVRRQQSPVQGFLDDSCAYTETANPVPLDELFPAYRAWARAADVDHPMDRERFGRSLASAGLRVERKMINGVRARRVHGIVPQIAEDGRTAWVALLNPLGSVPPVT
jgi:putative DNA primase/helicase